MQGIDKYEFDDVSSPAKSGKKNSNIPMVIGVGVVVAVVVYLLFFPRKKPPQEDEDK